MRCPNCKTINPPQAKFCLECGIRFNICPHCGTFNLPQAKFCIECGSSFVQSTLIQPTDEPSSIVSTHEAGITIIKQPQLAEPTEQTLEATQEERRLVTVMFADIIGST